MAAVLAAALMVVALVRGTWVAGGADSYGYLSEAALWRAGSFHQAQPFALGLPWPGREWTATPLGYRPVEDSPSADIVPAYSPGLPFVMAAASVIGGDRAMFTVVPFFGALFVLATYFIGARMASPSVGLAAAFLVATSPAVIFIVLWPMTDVPVAACWALASAAVLGSSRLRMFAGGLAAALAIFIRPNLVWIGVLMGLWVLARDLASTPRRIDRAALFAVGALPGVAAVAAFNQALFGSPLVSGYGRFSESFALDRFAVNARNYFSAFTFSQTPIALAGAAALLLPIRWLWRERARDAALFTLIAVGTLGSYLFYLTFPEWWYLRFLLPLWPGLFIGLTWLLYRAAGDRFTWWNTAIVLSLGAYGVWFAQHRAFYDLHETERRYVVAATLARDETPPNSVIFTMQHSGSVRYYGERMTLRYDNLPPEWLDRGIAWLAEQGAHPYILLDEFEVPEFKKRFAGIDSPIARLEVGTVFELEQPGHVYLFDPLAPRAAAWPRIRRPPTNQMRYDKGAPPALVFDDAR